MLAELSSEVDKRDRSQPFLKRHQEVRIASNETIGPRGVGRAWLLPGAVKANVNTGAWFGS